MADDSLTATYTINRRTADREELDAWLAQEAANPPQPAPSGPTTPTPEAKPKPGVIGAAASAVKDTFLEGASNFIHGITRKHESMGDFKPEGQQLLGVLQVLSALPAGAGAAVQAALGKYAPGLEGAVAIPGGKAGESTAAGMVRATLSAPSLVLDPKMKEAIVKNPVPLAEALNEPMTYGELANIVAQFATPWAIKKGAGLVRGRGGAPGAEAPRAVEGEIVTEGAPPPRALPPGREPLALPEAQPEPLVTPPPERSSSLDTRLRAAQAQGPEAYARAVAQELRDALEQAPEPDRFRETLRERYRTQMQEAPRATTEPAAAAAAAPEGPLQTAGEMAMAGQPERPGTLTSALDAALRRSEEILAEEFHADVAAAHEGPTPTVEAVAGPLSHETLNVRELPRTARQTEAAPNEIIQRVEAEMPTATAAAKEARINELMGVPGVEAPVGMAAGKIDTGMLARMGLGAALGGTQGDTPEERIRNAFLGIGLGAVVSKRLATRLAEAYKTSGLADETGALNVNAFRKKPSVQASEQPFQPNYQRITETASVKATMKNMHRAMKEDILARRGPARSNDLRTQEALGLIDQGKMTPERILTLGDQEMLTDSEITAARILSTRSFRYATEIRERVLKGEAVPEGSLKESLAIAGAMGRNTRVAQTRIAQAQQASSIRVGGESVSYRPEDVAALADEILPDMTDKQVATLMGSMTPEQVGKAATFWSLFPRMGLEALYFAYLSGKAIPRNLVGNLSLMAIAPPIRGIARFMPLWGSKKPGVLPGEATQMARALGDSLLDHVRMLRHIDEIDQQAAQLGLGKGIQKSERRQPGFARESFAEAGVENDTLLTLADWTGNTLRAPGAVLDKTDVASKNINGIMAHRIEAFRQATFEGLTGDAFEGRVGELLDDVTKLNQTARQRIVEFADSNTLTKELQGRVLGAIARGPENEWLNLAYRSFIMPFFRITANMTEKTLSHMPVLNLLAAEFWRDFRAGGTQRQVAQARVVFGAAIVGSFMYVESQGGITGNRPKDPKLAALWDAAGYQERSWWDPVSDKWRSYDGLGPLTSMIAGAADTSMTIRKLPEADAMHVFTAYLLSQIRSLDSRTFTQSISNFTDMVKNPKGDSQVEQAMTYLRKQIAGWLKPGAVRELETLGDPEVRRVIRNGKYENSAEREYQALLDEVRAGWPGFSSEKDEHGNFLVPPHRNPVTGEPTIVESWPFNPFPGRSPKDIPVKKPDGTTTGVFAELLRLNGAGIDELPDWMGGGNPGADVGMAPEQLRAGIRLTPQEKDRWVVLMTQVVKPLGGTYPEALKAEMETERYWEQSDGLRGTDGGKATRLQQIERAYRVTAETQLQAESPKLGQAIKQRQGERLINKAPTAQQPGLKGMLDSLLR